MRNLITFICLLFGFYAFAQTPLVSGRVTNAKGEPVSFATIRVKGTKISIAAEADGSFKVRATKGQTLINYCRDLFAC